MNKIRRKEINKIINMVEELHLCDNIDNELVNIIDKLSIILSEEEYYLYNIPDNLQNGYRYQTSEDACDNLQDAINCLTTINKNNVADVIQNVVDLLSDAMI